MRVDNVDQVKGIGFIKFNTDTEMDLIAESMDRLVKKQKKIADKAGSRADTTAELEKLERFKKSKDMVIEIPKQNRMRIKAVKDKVKTKFKEEKDKEDKQKQKGMKPDGLGGETEEITDVEDTPEFKQMNAVMTNAEEGSGLREGTEVTHRDMHVLANSLNNHIWEMEKDGLNKKTRRNELKYEKLQQLLANVQEQKSKFERVRPKPKGFGRLRK